MTFTHLNPTLLLIFSLGKRDCWIIPHVWNIIHTSHKIWLNCEENSINYTATFHLVFCIYLVGLTFFALSCNHSTFSPELDPYQELIGFGRQLGWTVRHKHMVIRPLGKRFVANISFLSIWWLIASVTATYCFVILLKISCRLKGMTGLPFPRVQWSPTGWQGLAETYDCMIVFSWIWVTKTKSVVLNQHDSGFRARLMPYLI